MGLWVIVPVKPLRTAKSRLSTVMTSDERYDFAGGMLRQLLHVVMQTSRLSGAIVISKDPKALSVARDAGAKTIRETGNSSLNIALQKATEVVRSWGADQVMILPADVPFITTHDLNEMIELGREYNTVVIAPDFHKDGTNGMLSYPPGIIEYQYGTESFHKHKQSALAAGAKVHVYESPTINLDIDVPGDLDRYNEYMASGEYEYLVSIQPGEEFT